MPDGLPPLLGRGHAYAAMPVAEVEWLLEAVHAWCDREGAWVRRAHRGDWPDPQRRDADEALLVCRPNLDVHFGRAGLHGERFGNLRTDSVESTMLRAMLAAGRLLDELWFGAGGVTDIPILAASSGQPDGDGLHFDAESVRYLWLDRRAAEPRLTRDSGG